VCSCVWALMTVCCRIGWTRFQLLFIATPSHYFCPHNAIYCYGACQCESTFSGPNDCAALPPISSHMNDLRRREETKINVPRPADAGHASHRACVVQMVQWRRTARRNNQQRRPERWGEKEGEGVPRRPAIMYCGDPMHDSFDVITAGMPSSPLTVPDDVTSLPRD